jgi:arylsulfatase A-like enzyme
MDKSVGDLLSLLDELDIADNTLVVFTSDNGGLSHDRRSMSPPHTHNAPLSSGKGAHHEGGIRVPSFVRWPGKIEQKQKTEIPIVINDWYPTLLEIANISVEHEIDGISLIPILQEGLSAGFQRPLIWHFPNFWGPLEYPKPVDGPGMGPCSAIRMNEWKLIYYYTDQRLELFNLDEDIGEQHNLAKENNDIAKELSITLMDYLKKVNAPMPVDKASGTMIPYKIEIN